MCTILLIEDNEMSRDMLSRRLSRNGYQVEAAIDTRDAMAKARSIQPDLILMDVSRPILGGFDFTRLLRGEVGRTPIIALASDATLESRDAALSAGCDEIEAKPVNMARLLDKISAIVGTCAQRSA